MGGFIDPKLALIFFLAVLVIFVSVLGGIIGLVIAFVTAKRRKGAVTEQKSFTFAMSAFIFGFFAFIFIQATVK